MFIISKDTPAYYITSVTNTRLPVFQKTKMKDLICRSINEARTSAGLLLFAYVIMPDHFHLLLGTERKPSECLRYVNGISSHRVIGFLKESGYDLLWKSCDTNKEETAIAIHFGTTIQTSNQ
jgi:REP element-mobilizing transposase RayT